MRSLPPHNALLSLFALSALLPAFSVAQSAANFDLYPASARSCLYAASDKTSCDTSSVPVYNACVCSNTDSFVANTAKCLAAEDPSDLDSVYSTLKTNCGNSGTPLGLSEDEWNKAASQGASSTSSPSSTPAPTSAASSSTAKETGTTTAPSTTGSTTASSTSSASPTNTSDAANNDNHDDQHKISTTGIIGIAVGVPVLLAMCGLIYVLWWRRRKQQPYTAIQGGQANPNAFGDTSGATAYGGYHPDTGYHAGGAPVAAKMRPESLYTATPSTPGKHDSSLRYFMQNQPPPPFYSQHEPIELQGNTIPQERHELP